MQSTQFTTFKVSHNKLSGMIPSFKNLPMMDIDLRYNQFEGLLPEISMQSLISCKIDGNTGLCRNFVPNNDLCGYKALPICINATTTLKRSFSSTIEAYQTESSITFVPIAFSVSGAPSRVQAAAVNIAELPANAIYLIISVIAALAIFAALIYVWIRKRRKSTKAVSIEANSITTPTIKSNFYAKISDDLELIQELSAGGFGQVYKGVFKGNVVAVKQLTTDDRKVDKINHVRMFIDEAEVMIEMKHERICKFIEFDVNSLSLIMEFFELGSLNSFIKRKKLATWTDRYQIMMDISEGMAFLHSRLNADGSPKKSVYHQDLKSANVLLTLSCSQLRAKIGDFGLSSK